MAYPFFLNKLLVRTGLARWLPSLRRELGDGTAFLRYYNDRVLASPYPALQDLAVFCEEHGPDTIDLALGEPRFDLAPSGSTKLPADRRGLPPPWGLPELREAIAARLHETGSLAPGHDDEVLVTPGVAGAWSLCLDTFLNPGDAVVLFDPTSPLYTLTLRQRRARVRWIPTWVEQGRLRFHLEPLVRHLKGARLIVLNSPANPTGAVISPEDVEQIAWWAHRRDVLIFNDEAFERFRYEGERAGIGTLPKARQRTLTAGSVSKGHALASARVGWLVGNRHLVRPCLLTAVLQGAAVPTLCQQVAASALRLGKELFRPIRDEFDARRRYAFARLQAMGLQPVWPAGAFFLWLPVVELGLSGRAFAEQLFQNKKVLVWPGEHFGPSGAGYVRLSYAAEDGRLRQGLARLAEFVQERQGMRVTQARYAA